MKFKIIKYFIIFLIIIFNLNFIFSLSLPGTWNSWNNNDKFTNIGMPLGYWKKTVYAYNDNEFKITLDGTWDNDKSWSAGYWINDWNKIWEIPRNDQGNNNNAVIKNLPTSPAYITIVSSSFNPSGTTNKFAFLWTSTNPSSIVIVSNKFNNVKISDSNIIYVHLDKNKCNEELIIIRWTTNNWSSWSHLLATNINNSNYCYELKINSPCQVEYYALISTTNGGDFLTYPDFMTINMKNAGGGTNFVYNVLPSTPHTIIIDGNNDFWNNELFFTTSSDSTNWITWDTNYIYFGFLGNDIVANNSNYKIVIYFSTNSNTGSAYGVDYNGQQPVLPFKADFVLNYFLSSTPAWDSAFWDGSKWEWSSTEPLPLTAGVDEYRGNANKFLEIRISKSKLGNTPYLDIYSHYIFTGTPSSTYSGIPSNTFTNGFDSNPTNYISFKNDIWQIDKIPNSNIYFAGDAIPPYTNVLIFPNGTIKRTLSYLMTNYADDNIGIYKIEFYTNTGGLYKTVKVTNNNKYYTCLLSNNLLSAGTYYFYTIAYDTRNFRISPSNVITVVDNNPPSKPTLLSPIDNDNNYFTRNAKLKWTCSDPDGDSLTYHIQIWSNNTTGPPLYNISNITTNWYRNYFWFDDNVYWSVRSFDGIAYSEWSQTNRFIINPTFIRVDGNISDWPPAEVIGTNVDEITTNGQWVWIDHPADVIGGTEHCAELTEFRITSDSNSLYFMGKVKGFADNAFISVTIDTNADGSDNGASRLYSDGETYVSSLAKFEFEFIACNYTLELGTGFYDSSGNWSPEGESYFQWGSPDVTNFELSIPWEDLRLSGPPKKLRFTVQIGKHSGSKTIVEQSGSDFLDCISTNLASIELSDMTNNVFFDLNFQSDGRILHTKFIVECPSNAIAGVPFTITNRARSYFGGNALGFTRPVNYSLTNGGLMYYYTNTGWDDGFTTETVIINYVGTNKFIVSDSEYPYITGESPYWINLTAPDIHINEVCFNPDGTNNDGQWLCIFNKGNYPVYLTNWAIDNGEGTFPFLKIDKFIILPPGCFLVLEDNNGIDDLDFSDGKGIIYKQWGNAVLKMKDKIGLFCDTLISSSNFSLVDFMAYDTNAGWIFTLATNKGIWTNDVDNVTTGLKVGGSLALFPDGNDNNKASDWKIDNTPTKGYSNVLIMSENFIVYSYTNGGYRDSIIPLMKIVFPDPRDDTNLNFYISNISFGIGGNISSNDIIEASLWFDNGASNFNYGLYNNNKPKNLLMGIGVYNQSFNGYDFINLSNSLIPNNGNITFYFAVKFSTNNISNKILYPYIKNNSVYLDPYIYNPIGPCDKNLSNSVPITNKEGWFIINELTDAEWAGSDSYKYQFIEIYNNSSKSITSAQLNWTISTSNGSSTLYFAKKNSISPGEIFLIVPGNYLNTFTNYYSINPDSPILTNNGDKIATTGINSNYLPIIIRENDNIIGIINFSTNFSQNKYTLEKRNPLSGNFSGIFEKSSITNGTPGFLNGFRAIEMNIINVSNYVLEMGSLSNLLLDFTIPSDNGNSDVLSMITIKNNGNATSNDLKLFLYKDIGNNGFTTDDINLGPFNYANNYRWIWNISNINISSSGNRFFVIGDINTNNITDGNTVRISIEKLQPVFPINYDGNFTNGVVLNSFNDGPVDSEASNISIQIIGVPNLTILKYVTNISGFLGNKPVPGSIITYCIEYSNNGFGKAYNVVIYDKIPDFTTYYTNYSGNATGWTVEFSGKDNPDQSYNSSDYTSSTNIIKWIRWKKQVVYNDEDNKTLYFGVTID